jgi:hypothetical protein
VRQETAHGGGPAHQAVLREEQLLAIELDAVGYTDKADHRTRPRAFEGLRHRFLGAYALQHGIGAHAGCQLLGPGYAGITALGNDVCRSVIQR